jgi:DNA invertase Pin-like site-specific DNA recombinase
MAASRRKRGARRDFDNPRVIGYLRVSTEEQAKSGAGIGAQRATIANEVARQGWTDVEYVSDPAWSAKDLNRPELDKAIERIERGEADVLIAAKLDRISRSVHDFSGLMQRAQQNGWRLICIDIAADTGTPAGELFAHITASVAQYERRVISQRTKDGLAAKRAAGVRLGRSPVLPMEVVRRIVWERHAGRKLREIAEDLTADGVPTARGGREWSTSSIQAVLAGQDAAKVDTRTPRR